MSSCGSSVGRASDSKFDGHGFEPRSQLMYKNKDQNFGSGMACGLLFACDLPYAILSISWNKIFKKFPLRSLGVISIQEILSTKDKNLEFYLGVILFGSFVFGWFHYNISLYILASITFIIGMVATFKVNLGKNEK